MIQEIKKTEKQKIDKSILIKGYELMATAREMSRIYEDNFKLVSKYVHSTSKGHES